MCFVFFFFAFCFRRILIYNLILFFYGDSVNRQETENTHTPAHTSDARTHTYTHTLTHIRFTFRHHCRKSKNYRKWESKNNKIMLADNIINRILACFKRKSLCIDNFVFSLHYRWTVILILLGFLLTSSKMYLGDNINCVSVPSINQKLLVSVWLLFLFS